MQHRRYLGTALASVAILATAAVVVMVRHSTDRSSEPRRSANGLAGPTRLVSFAGYQTRVPASWPVYDLRADPTRCVRFDQHAVYLGTPGPDQNCPAHAVGRTEALLVRPLSPGASHGGSPPDRSEPGLVRADLGGAGVSVTASYVEGDESLGMAMSFVTPTPQPTATPSAGGATTGPGTGPSTPAGTGAGSAGTVLPSVGSTDGASPAPTSATPSDPAEGGSAEPAPTPTDGEPATPTTEPDSTPSAPPTTADRADGDGTGTNAPPTGEPDTTDPTATPTEQPTTPDSATPTSTTGTGTRTSAGSTNVEPTGQTTRSTTTLGPPGATATAAPDGGGLIAPTATRPPVPRMPLPAPVPVRLLTEGLGFDTCAAPSLTSMAAWRPTSLNTVGIYVGGANRACPDGNLSASWVTKVHGYGYTFAPIYVGLQPPCTTFSRRIDPRQARAQGVAAANDAVTNMRRFGFGTRNPIFLDIEFFTPPAGDTTCSKAVLGYQTGWTRRLHELHYTAGLYTASGGVRDLAAIAPTSSPTSTFAIPDVVWLARWNNTANTDFAPHAPVALWNLRRLKQYTGGHAENHAGVTINIDRNYVHGAIARPGNY